jgi:hypothetical protein
VRAALFKLAKIGDVYDKVVEASDRKLYIIRLSQKTDAHDRTYAEAERSIRVRLVQDKIREKEEALLAQLKGQFPVQIDDAVLAGIHVDLASEPSAPGDALAPAPTPPAPPGSAPTPPASAAPSARPALSSPTVAPAPAPPHP